MAGIKRDKRDKIFSMLVRERATWRCERCGKHHPPPTNALHCAHFYTRRARGTRWDPDGAAALCYGCHQHLDSHPEEKKNFVLFLLGEDKYDQLTRRYNKPHKLTKIQMEELYQHLKSEHERLQALREEGKVGWLNFCRYEVEDG